MSIKQSLSIVLRLWEALFPQPPSRFGKSLLLSTNEAYFLGKRELFKGLAIERLETEWNVHAVLHLDLNAEKYDSPDRLHDMLERQLLYWEEIYETGGKGITHSGRFMEVIRKAYEKTGRGVVVLIDEYDKPLLNSFHDETLQKAFRDTLTAFYSVLKSADPWLRLVFITGVTKFAQMGIFSNLNQLKDISLDPRYATLCGLTGEEIRANFVPELKLLAEANTSTGRLAWNVSPVCMTGITSTTEIWWVSIIRSAYLTCLIRPCSIISGSLAGLLPSLSRY